MESQKVVKEVRPDKEYILIGDISGSMSESDPRCANQPRYDYMLEKFKLFISEASKFDEHGKVDVILFGEKVHIYKEVTLDEIRSKLNKVDFEGATMTDKALEMAYNRHLEKRKDEPNLPGTVCFVFTDGMPTNRKAVEDVIIDIANHIQKEDDFNITFLTVGSVPLQVDSWLTNLHDEVEKKLKRDFDIIHVEKLEDVDFLGAVNTVNHD